MTHPVFDLSNDVSLGIALRSRPTVSAPQARDLVLEGNGWCHLSGDARLGACATEGCGGQPVS